MAGLQQTGFVPRDYDVFAGLDVDKKSIAVTFSDHAGTIKSMRTPYSAANLLGYVSRAFEGKKVAFVYEAGPTGYGLYDELTAAGYPCLVVSSSMVPTARGHHVKTNRLDSKKLSESLRGGQLRGIRVPSMKYRHLRELIQHRDTCVRQATASKLRIKALLLFEGIPYPEARPGTGQWTKGVLGQLKQIPCARPVRFKIDELIANLEFAQSQTLNAMTEIRRFCLEDEEILRCINLLTSIPGIGWITATHLLARIGDWRQMGNVRQLGAFLGLTQREESTGDDVNKGSITRAGDGRLRSKLIQAAWSAIRIDPELHEFYLRIYERHPRHMAPKKGIVAVARKMSMRIHAVLSKQRPYVVRGVMPLQSKTREEIIRPRERLDSTQNQEKLA